MMVRRLALLLLLCLPALVNAQSVMMARSKLAFPEAMSALQQSVTEHGYTISRVQRVDIGLTRSGYKTDLYRVVFFGKPDELRQLTKEYPEMIPYLPLKVVIFAEQGETLVAALNPLELAIMFPKTNLDALLHRWANDFQSIFADVRTAQ